MRIRQYGSKPVEPPYTVLVDDNYRYTDQSDRYTMGQYASLEAAIQAGTMAARPKTRSLLLKLECDFNVSPSRMLLEFEGIPSFRSPHYREPLVIPAASS